MTYDGQKRKIQFYNPATVDTDPSELVYVVISATPQMLDEIGGLTFASGSRFPAKEQYSNFPFNEETRQELIYIGLQLMGAAELSFDGDWSDSLDDDFHLTWEQDSADKGLWHLHLNNPIISDGTDGREIELDKSSTHIRWRYVGDGVWIDLVPLSDITGPAGEDGEDGTSGADGVDGNDGSDGREVEFRVSGGYIQWEYVTDDTWHNLVALATLTGAQGPQGEPGTDGADGADGEDGADGVDTSTPPDHGMTPSDTTRCSVAVAVVNYVYGVFTGALRMDSTARSEIISGTGGIGLALGLIFPGLGAVIAAGVAGAALYATLLDIEANGYIPYFDTTVKDDLRCILYCLLDNNGLYTEAVHNSFKAQINASTEPLYDAIYAVMDKSGYKPFQWGALSAPLLAAPDCESCDLCEDQVAITYAYGTGPALVSVGDEFTVNPADFSGSPNYSFINMNFDKCVNVQWVSGTGVHPSGGSLDMYWRGTSTPACPGGTDTYYLTSTDDSEVNTHVGETHEANYISSTAEYGRGDIVLKIVSIA